MLKVDLYGKAGCAMCLAAADKLVLLGLEFEKHEISTYVDYHEGWKEDGSVEISSAYYMFDQKLPIIRVDGDFFNYPGAMRRLRREEA